MIANQESHFIHLGNTNTHTVNAVQYLFYFIILLLIFLFIYTHVSHEGYTKIYMSSPSKKQLKNGQKAATLYSNALALQNII